MKNRLLVLLSAFVCAVMLSSCTGGAVTDNSSVDENGSSSAQSETFEGAEVKIATLNGPTTIGVVSMLKSEDTVNTYKYDQIYASADAFAPSLLKNEINAAIIPCNAAATLHKNSGGKIKIAAVNNLGVLYILEKGETVKSVEDLRGKTIVSTGAGTTPQYSLEYVLKKNGLEVGKDVTVEYKSEPTEVLAALKKGNASIAMLPQPAATNALGAVEGLRTALNLTEEWEKVDKTSSLVTGVLVVNSAWAESNPDAVKALLKDYKASCEKANDDVKTVASYVTELKIAGITNEAVAEKAIPLCNIKYIDGEEMKATVSGYLKVLYESNPKSVGGEEPTDALYYIAE